MYAVTSLSLSICVCVCVFKSKEHSSCEVNVMPAENSDRDAFDTNTSVLLLSAELCQVMRSVGKMILCSCTYLRGAYGFCEPVAATLPATPASIKNFIVSAKVQDGGDGDARGNRSA